MLIGRCLNPIHVLVLWFEVVGGSLLGALATAAVATGHQHHHYEDEQCHAPSHTDPDDDLCTHGCGHWREGGLERGNVLSCHRTGDTKL